MNFNGREGMSIAAPNIAAHAELIHRCYSEAGADPRNIGYIEAQGMANPSTDIAEWEAFNRALGQLAEERGISLTPLRCGVSSLKPMAGHMHATSALGALFKIIRSLQTNRLHGILAQLRADTSRSGYPRPAVSSARENGNMDPERTAPVGRFAFLQFRREQRSSAGGRVCCPSESVGGVRRRPQKAF